MQITQQKAPKFGQLTIFGVWIHISNIPILTNILRLAKRIFQSVFQQTDKKFAAMPRISNLAVT